MPKTAKDSIPSSHRTRRQIMRVHHCLVALFLAAVVCTVFRPWLRPFHQPQRGGPEKTFRAGDLTPLFSVWTQITARSLFEHGEFPLWSDHIYCGEPFFAKPQIGVISLTTLLCGVLPGQVAATWTFLLHLWIAGMAAYAWNLDILRDIPTDSEPVSVEAGQPPAPALSLAAAIGAVTFMLSGLMAEQAMIGHGPIVLVACWTPLVLRSVGRAFVDRRPIRHMIAAGGLVAVQLLAGGETIFLYTAMAGGLLGVFWVLAAPIPPGLRAAGLGRVGQVGTDSPSLRWGRGLRVAAVGGLIGVVGFGLAAVKVLPGLELIPVTNRAEGLSLEDASARIVEIREPALLRSLDFGTAELADRNSLFVCTLLCAAVGCWAGMRGPVRRSWALTAAGMLVGGVAIAHSRLVFAALWHVLPMFHYQRIPQRALVLAYLGLNVLVALGVHRLLGGVRSPTNAAAAAEHAKRSGGGGALRWVGGWVLLVVITVECSFALPGLTPTVDIRQEIRDNAILNHLSGLAKQTGPFRIHAIESTDRNWGIEHVTVPLGLSNLTGWDHLWLLEFLGAEGNLGRDVRPFLSACYQARHPARFWGLMNVRYVTATRAVELPGLRFVEKFPDCATCQPAKSAGPYLYENAEWLPRGWIVPHAVLVLGDRAERLEATYRIIDHPLFDPRQVVVVQSDRTLESYGTRELADYRAVILPARWGAAPVREELEQPRPLAPTYSVHSREFWTQPSNVAALLAELCPDSGRADSTHSELSPVVDQPQFELHRPGRVIVRLSAKQTGFLVLAEKFAHFPGWSAMGTAGVCPLLKANGVASAVRIEPDGIPRQIEFSYTPTGFLVGAAISVLSGLGAVVLCCWDLRRKPDDTVP